MGKKYRINERLFVGAFGAFTNRSFFGAFFPKIAEAWHDLSWDHQSSFFKDPFHYEEVVINMHQLYYCSSTSSESEFSLLSPGDSREQLNGHLEGHFEHQCDKCDYTSRTEGRLKQHIQRFHGNDDFNDGRL